MRLRHLIFFGLLFSVSCSMPQDVAVAGQQEQQQQERKWTTVAKWSGTSTKTTETFNVQSSEWRIHWALEGDAYSILQIFVYNDKGAMVSLAANQLGPSQDVSYVRAPAGKYYLTINTANSKYAIIVADQR